MKKQFLLFLVVGVVAALVYAYPNGAAYNSGIDGTKASGGGGCGSCHGSTTSLAAKVELDSAGVAVTSYHPGMAYTVKISATNSTTSTLPKFGFQLTVVNSVGAGSNPTDVGTWGTMPGSVRKTTPAQSGLTETIIEQSTQITATSGSGGSGTTYVESIPWTAPAAGTGSVIVYGVMNAINNNGGQSGDKYMTATQVTITEAVTTPVVAGVSVAITNGTNPACSGSSITFTATPTNGGSSPTYQWQINGSNAGTGSTFTTSSLTNGQSVTCVMTSNLSGVTGNPATSNAVTMAINTATTPTISQNGNVLTSSSASTYQWYNTGNMINGATSQSYTATQTGSYTVQITDANGCSATSTATDITVSGIQEATDRNVLNVFPNPFSSSLNIHIGSAYVGADLKMFDTNGKLVYAGKANNSDNAIELNAPAGVYMVQIVANNRSYYQKVVKY